MKEISVDWVIPAFNAEKTLSLCLESVSKQNLHKDQFQIRARCIVVDNGSTDRTSEIAKNWEAEVIKVLERGRSRARNAGYRASIAEFVAFLDADVVLDPNWTVDMVSAIIESRRIGGIESPVLSAILGKKNCIENVRRRMKYGREIHLKNEGLDHPVINTAACLYRRAALNDVGGFDESLYRYEDTDLSKRISWAGWILGSQETSLARCYNDQATWWGFGKRYFDLGVNRFFFSYKWAPEDSRLKVACREIGTTWSEFYGHVFTDTRLDLDVWTQIRFAFVMFYLLSLKLLGRLIAAAVLFRPVKRIERKPFSPVTTYQNRSCSLTVHESRYTLFSPATHEFFRFKRAVTVDILLQLLERIQSHVEKEPKRDCIEAVRSSRDSANGLAHEGPSH